MTVNAFKKFNRPPTSEELRSFSHYSSYSISAGVVYISIHFLFIFAVTFLHPVIEIILLFIEYPLLTMLYDKGKLDFLQKLDTEDPTDTELEVAALGIKVWYDNEIKDSNDDDDIGKHIEQLRNREKEFLKHIKIILYLFLSFLIISISCFTTNIISSTLSLALYNCWHTSLRQSKSEELAVGLNIANR